MKGFVAITRLETRVPRNADHFHHSTGGKPLSISSGELRSHEASLEHGTRRRRFSSCILDLGTVGP
jgi:hypothetical protein